MDAISELFAHLQGRSRPEDVAECVLRAIGSRLDAKALKVVSRAARGSYARSYQAYSSMATSFFHAQVAAAPQVELAQVLFAGLEGSSSMPVLSAVECRDPQRLEDFVRQTGQLIHRTFGDRRKLDKRARYSLGLMKGHRWYNKRFRLLARLEQKIVRMVRADRRFDLVRISKSSLATRLTRAEFARDLDSACFIAYYASRMSLRSEFTCGSQVRPYDEVAEVLLAHCERGSPNYYAIAHALPETRILRHLTENERGRLLATSFDAMARSADLLEEVWEKSHIDKRTMIVARGNDSSTWNESAGAWNKARESWIAMLHALGMEGLLDRMLPGKVMRLMAADVAAWHRLSGGTIHPDTAVFSDLPLPWQVLRGEVDCSRARVKRACEAHGASVEGWTGPRSARTAVPFRPTPELLHGVTISSPTLARTMRKLGYFSGKPSSSEAQLNAWILRDAHGFALLALEPEDH